MFRRSPLTFCLCFVILPFLLLVLGVALWRAYLPQEESSVVTQVLPSPARVAEMVAAPVIEKSGEPEVAQVALLAEPSPAAEDAPVVSQLRPDRRWRGAVAEPVFADFRAWTDAYFSAPAKEQGEMLAEGVSRVQARRAALGEMIRSHPDRALDLAVPESVRRLLPAVIVTELEETVRGRGDLVVAAAMAVPGGVLTVPAVQRSLKLGNREFDVFTSGARADLGNTANLAVHGLAIGNALALADHPLRVLEPVEMADAKSALGSQPVCPASGQPTNAGEDGEETALAAADEPPSFFCGPNHAQIAYEGAISAESTAASVIANSGYTEGTKKMLILRVDFPDAAGQVVSDATLTTLVNNFATQWLNMSYGKTTWHPVGTGSAFTPTLRLPLGHANYTSLGTMLAAARDAAATAGFRYQDYDFDVVVTGDKPDVGFGGVAYVGGRGAWLANGQWNLGVGTHEVGHNFSLNHAGFWDTTDGTTIGAGSNVEYGNPYDHMGGASSNAINHFGARQKNQLDWLPDADVRHVTTDGTVTQTIAAMDKKEATGMRAVAVDKAGTDNDYWIEYRQLQTGAYFKDGVVVNWGRNAISNAKPILLDMNPGTSDKADSPLLIGQTFSDTAGKIHITPTGKSTDAVTGVISVNVVVSRGDFAGNLKPTASLTTATPNPAVNANATLTCTATDPNSDPLAYFWDWGDGSWTANNATANTHKWTTAGAKTIRCVVSDMKGLRTTAQYIIVVGTTTTFVVSGTVVDALGANLAGVTVSTGTGLSDATDSEGFYAITGVPAGSFTLTATKSPLQIAPNGFTNPVVLGPSVQNLNWKALPGAPAWGKLKPALIDKASNSGAIFLPITDPDTAATALTLTASSDNLTLIPNTSVGFAAKGALRTATITPVSTQSGTANVTLTATDPQGTASTVVWPVTVNAAPAVTPPAVALTVTENSFVDVDLPALTTDDLSPDAQMRFEVDSPLHGTVELLPNQKTARFTPFPGYQGAASFRVTATDPSLSSRLFQMYTFESPDVPTDNKVDDSGNFNRTGTLTLVGAGEMSYGADVPAALAPFSAQSLSLTETGEGNAARLTKSVSADELNLNDADWSATGWFKRATKDSEDIIFYLGTDDGDATTTTDELKLGFSTSSDVCVLSHQSSTTRTVLASAPGLLIGEWHHFAVAYDRTATNLGTFSLFVDGNVVGTPTSLAVAIPQPSNITFGGHALTTANTVRYWDGKLDDLSFWNSLLTPAEIARIAHQSVMHSQGLATALVVPVTVTGNNDAPIISPLVDIGTGFGKTTGVQDFAISDAEKEPNQLVLTATSSDTALLPFSGISLTAVQPWSGLDIGAVGRAGSQVEDRGSFLVNGSGADVTGTLDEFRYVSQPLTGDGELAVRVNAVTGTTVAKAGVMLREGVAADAVNAFICFTPGAGVQFQTRATAAATTTVIASDPALLLPAWVRLVRTGTVVTAFTATDINGLPGAWKPLGAAQTLSFTAPRLGMAVSSKTDGTLAQGVFDRVVGSYIPSTQNRITLTPTPGMLGRATVTLNANDGTTTTSQTFTLFAGENTAPAISPAADVTAVDGATIPSFTLNLSDLHTDVAALALTATSSNPTLLPANRIVLSGTGANRTVTLRPIPSASGTATVTLTVSDGSLTTTRVFVVNITPGDPSYLVRAGAAWHWLATTPSGWPNLSATAADTWAWGPAPLGYGDPHIATVITATSRISSYLHHSFVLDDPHRWAQLKIRLLRDDGVALYLNGKEIVRTNLPDGPLTANTLAPVAVSAPGETTYYPFTVNEPNFVAGTNVLTVELHQSTAASSDLGFDIEIIATNPAPQVPIAAGGVWKFLDTNVDPGATWVQPTFDDTLWKSGAGELGYGDGDEATLCESGPTTARYPSIYFRRKFTATDVKNLALAYIRVLRDDGCVFYLNGTEVARNNMPTGAIAMTTLAAASVGNADEKVWHTLTLDRKLLLEGENTLAVSVHQASATSSDISFNAEVKLYGNDALPKVQLARSGQLNQVTWPAWAEGWELYSSTDLVNWTRNLTVPATTQGRTGMNATTTPKTVFYRLEKAP